MKKKAKKANMVSFDEEVVPKQVADELLSSEVENPVEKKAKKRKKITEPTNPDEGKKTESIRALKRKKYAKLLEDKKNKTELALQEKALNYLSKWKHSRDEWKFEKLRQIWLQHNMYDEVKVPPEFWQTLVEYFSNSKGKSREVLLKEAVAIIEGENDENQGTCKLERARDIIQNLQE
ncbi:uncharacterized protein C7orf50 homolog [Tribolium castaneum]|uniref:Uncharacterized protein C7orf50 homolog-like Protein n=1 Tax=Tribolium castaneum TaxID=7070 RepID=D2A1F2_TRICA|nr:PREDICTED: uncharacterized protein C7orf50 homolog [Tribolium castaneum]EFA02103.1 Uncharacterized protein C7orf50 homolog-like Protein [Tribolium castaneum]|eukprot:XP_008191528.1 PREDICTED: uncharacterized protein C7orf50 homolog [Tribolium castaneum]